MTSTLRLLLLGLVVLLGNPLRAAVPLVNLVDENCPLVVSVRDLPAFLKNGADSPWAKTWNDEQMKKFLAPFRAQMKVDKWDEDCKAETGYTVTELIAMAKGQVLFALTGTEVFELGDNPDPSRVPVLMAVEVGDNADKITKIIAENDEKEREASRTEDYAGVQLRIYQDSAESGGGDMFVWAMADGIWFLSPSKAVVQAAIDHLKKGRASAPLGESERYLKISKQAPGADVIVLVNIQSLYPAAKLAIEKSTREKPQAMGLTPGIVMDALGLDALRDLYLCVQLAPEATVLNGGLTCSEQRGFFKMLAFNDGPVPQPSFASEKWVNVSVGCFSLPAAYDALKEILNTLNPMFSNLMQGQIKQLNQQLGIDLERDLVGSLGSQMLAAKAMRPGTNPDNPPPLSEIDQLIALSLNNAPAFTKAVDALKRMSGPQFEKMLNKRDYLGQTIYTLEIPNPQPGQKSVSYTITPKYLFLAIGSASILESAVQGLDGKQPSIWQKPEVKAAIADVPATACTFEYQDNRAMIGSLIETLVQLGTQFASRRPAHVAESEDGDSDEALSAMDRNGPFDLDAKPDAAALGKFWGNSSGYGWRDSNGLFFQSKVQHPK